MGARKLVSEMQVFNHICTQIKKNMYIAHSVSFFNIQDISKRTLVPLFRSHHRRQSSRALWSSTCWRSHISCQWGRHQDPAPRPYCQPDQGIGLFSHTYHRPSQGLVHELWDVLGDFEGCFSYERLQFCISL